MHAERRTQSDRRTSDKRAYNKTHPLWFNPLPHSVQSKSIFQNTPNVANKHEACTTVVQQRSDNAIEICLHKQIHFFLFHFAFHI